jgi:DNA-binding NtrC family response regulator
MTEIPNILFVDDEPLMLSMWSQVLEDNYKIHISENGADALTIIGNYPIAVVVSDERMPNMKGHELLERARELSPTTMRILLTGYADFEAIQSAVNSGQIFRYLTKPCEREKMVKSIDAALAFRERLIKLSPQLHHRKAAINSANEKLNLLFVGFSAEDIVELLGKVSRKHRFMSTLSLAEAEKILTKDRADILFCETLGGGETELRFLLKAKERFPESHIVLIAHELDIHSLTRGINELQVFKYLLKPLTAENVERTILEVIEKRIVNP